MLVRVNEAILYVGSFDGLYRRDMPSVLISIFLFPLGALVKSFVSKKVRHSAHLKMPHSAEPHAPGTIG